MNPSTRLAHSVGLSVSPSKLLLLLLSLTASSGVTRRTEHCDVIVAGGSIAALAAALGAARDNAQLQVCLTEPTDWLGGQLTSAGVPAVDFGRSNRNAEFQPSDFADMMASLGSGNPGACWVSTNCYLPRLLVDGWIARSVASLPNLHVFYNTVIKRVQRQGRVISAVEAVQRQAKDGFDQWSVRLSQVLQEWYSEQDTSWFSKTLLRLEGRHNLVVVEATEYGDVLVLARAPFHQGTEIPTEASSDTLDTCGQAFTFPFFIQNGGSGGVPVPEEGHGSYSLGDQEWGHVWSYRRVQHVSGPYHASSPGDVSNQNWGDGNDYKDAYIFLSRHYTQQQRDNWQGGLNLAAIREAEDRAFGWYRYYVGQAPPDVRDNLSMAGQAVAGTATGLSKVPYIRDSRRSVGLHDYQLQKSDFADTEPGTYGPRYNDTVALGDYLYADVHGAFNCPYPGYVNAKTIKPFYVPFRALTNRDVDNLLVAGKTMAANAATRMHPVEWGTGLAAGLASSLMTRDGLTSQQLWQRVQVLQAKLRAVTSLDWHQPRPLL